MQTPLSLAAGLCLYFSIPKAFTTSMSSPEKQSIGQKLARIDYAGAVLLVSPSFALPISKYLLA